MIKKSQIFYAPSEEGVEIGTYKSSFTKNYWEFKNEYTIHKFRKWFKRAGIEESGITGSGLKLPICANMVIQNGPKWSGPELPRSMLDVLKMEKIPWEKIQTNVSGEIEAKQEKIRKNVQFKEVTEDRLKSTFFKF